MCREGAIRFDLALCSKFRYPQDFDHEKYTSWLRLSGITGRSRTEDVLVNIEAAERAGERLAFRNAGVLFFAKNVRHFFNQAYITCLLAKGIDKVDVLDRKDFDGGIVADIEDAMRFIERNTRTAWRIEALRRENIPEYPMKALREAITNAVMHRDWFMDGANVFVELYTDRIEVSSPGGLPKGMTLSDLGHKSIRRNVLIADMLHRIEFIEKAGTGIKRIRDDARDHGCPEPRFEETGFVTATFYLNPEVRVQSTDQVGNVKGAPGAQSRAQSGAQSGAQSDRVLRALKEGVGSAQELATTLGLRSKTGALKRTLNELLGDGLIELTIQDKPSSRLQRYRITPHGLEILKRNKETK